MTHRTRRGALGLAVTCLAFAIPSLPSLAQTAAGSTTQATNKTAWAVFAEGTPKECWAVSRPKSSVNTRDGKEVSVKRSAILLYVTFRPNQEGSETSFAGGYPFAQGSTVAVEIDDQSFTMTTKGEYAWVANPDDEAKILAAMQKGSVATLTARSAKGTQTEDSFSLSGFTAAITDAQGQCQ